MDKRDFGDGKKSSRKGSRQRNGTWEIEAARQARLPFDSEGLHLGYRKGKSGGPWVLRQYLGDERYEVKTFAEADDRLPADGVHILDFFQAQDRAREIAQARLGDGTVPAAPLTVNMALDAYFERLEHEGSKSLADARGRADKHIRPALGDKWVGDLTRDTLSQWHRGLAEKAKDGNAGDPSQQRDRNDADARRRRRASANRVFTILRAALNQAFSDGKVETDAAWRAVKPFREVDAPRLRYFTKDEVRRLINAAHGDFRDLVKAALFTGCRYGGAHPPSRERFQPGLWNGLCRPIEERQGPARGLDRRGQGVFRSTYCRPARQCLDAHPCGRLGRPASRHIRPWKRRARPPAIAG